ncbi:MAG: 4Fe-4S binding protein [Methanomicrobiales archaeon]|nr:4Fe-4S binding protein [Methanomicrobiales archaeon]
MNRQQLRGAILLLSFLLMSVTFVYFSPYGMMIGLVNGVIAAAFIFWIVIFALTLFIGRAFCGYICPMGAEQEIADRVLKTDLRVVPYLRYLKYLLAIIWVGGAVFLAAAAGRLVPDPLYGIGTGLPPWTAPLYLFFYGMTLGVFVLVLILGRRGMCNYFCPMSVGFIAISALKNRLRIPSLHLEAEKENCIRCKKCTAACPMSLPVQEMVENDRMQEPECILCGNCTGACPKNVLHLAWKWN